MSTNGESGAVYVQTNEPENRVIGFRRAADGALEKIGAYATGGAGSGMPHLPSQGSVVLSGDGRRLLVTNAASGDVSVFAVGAAGLELLQTVPSGGESPRSVAERDGLVYVLNTADPSLAGFRLGDGGLEPVPGSRRELADGADPAQAGFSPDGAKLVVTERGTNAISFHEVRADGTLGEAQSEPSSGPTPYGFAFAGGGTLVVTEAFGAQKGKAAASSYVLANGSATPVSRSVGNGRSEICWAVVTKDGRYAFTTNFADGAVSRYAVGPDGALVLEDAVAGIAVEGETGLRDEGLSADGRFLYAIDADSRRIFGWRVGDGGALAPVGSWEGLPATVAGLAAL
ncbi:MAG TPA: beta-propeller fold lactonase family protein [Gaiellaceae bacterium]|nr:beta-propeller fold lactonase family protein [Gaiellaceae bacterium]